MTELKESFDKVADEYDRYRTAYDPFMIADIKSITALTKGAVACEIGAGTGQASGGFASDVSKLVCVEPGANLADRLRNNLSSYDNVEILNTTFEDADLVPTYFDLVFAGQSFHWVDSTVRYQKVSEVLKPGGWFAAFWKRWIPSGKESFSEQTKLFQEYLPKYTPPSPKEHEVYALSDLAEMVGSELFARCQLRRYPSPRVPDNRSPEERAESCRTWSEVAALEKDMQDDLITRLKQIYRSVPIEESNNETTLIIGQKRG